jgi:hypothetical protein
MPMTPRVLQGSGTEPRPLCDVRVAVPIPAGGTVSRATEAGSGDNTWSEGVQSSVDAPIPTGSPTAVHEVHTGVTMGPR